MMMIVQDLITDAQYKFVFFIIIILTTNLTNSILHSAIHEVHRLLKLGLPDPSDFIDQGSLFFVAIKSILLLTFCD